MTDADVYDTLERLSETGLVPPGKARMIDVGTDTFMQFFEEEILDGFVARGGSTCRIFEGTYGSGKTHLLQLIEHSALDRRMLVAKTDLSQSLQFGDWRLITKHVLEHCVATIQGDRTESLPIVLERYGEIVDNAEVLLSPGMPHPGFARAMHLALTGQYPSEAAREKVHQFLLGERVTVSDLSDHGIRRVKNPLSKRNSEHIIRTVGVGMARLGMGGVALLFDENERTLSTRSGRVSKKIMLTANAMRRLIDAFATGRIAHVLTVFAVLPGFMERAEAAYPALGQRVGRPIPFGGVTGWRTPVLLLDDVNRFRDVDDFVAELARRFGALVGREDCVPHLREAGMRIVSMIAGSDYRRPLLKHMASTALRWA